MELEIEKAIGKLIELTQKGDLTWRPVALTELSKRLPPSERLECAFHSDYKGKGLVIYKVHFSVDVQRGGGIGILGNVYQSVYGVGRTEERWVESVRLELTDAHRNVLWRFPAVAAMTDLLEAVQYSAAGVKEFVDSLLSQG